jgi:glycosyltransferase involved in cell wall biosynthesis
LRYVGVGDLTQGLASLRQRGFEAHELRIGDYESTLEGLRAILAGRRLASLSMIDTLGRMPNGDEVLRAIREIIAESNAPAVISVPNVAHRDVGFRLAFGRWDTTRHGLLDHTLTRLFSEATFGRTLEAAGLQVVAGDDVRVVKSDQSFPRSHPALAEGTTLNEYLAMLRSQVDGNDTVNQFVRLTLAGPQSFRHAYLEDKDRDQERPFLSIVTRTQGRRLHCLVEVLTALAGQEDSDFEVLIVGHKLSQEQRLAVERIIEDCPDWLRALTRLVRVYDGGRSRPLNRGFEEAQGQYIAILDDDDLPMAHWLSTFRKLAERKPGAILRAVTARQEVENVSIRGRSGVRAIGGLSPYPGVFDLIEHFECNQSPPVCLAFPRGVFHDLNIRFDETLTTTEDWDFLLRAAAVVGVSATEQITSIYRWWDMSDESSRSLHDEREWAANHSAIYRKMDRMPILLPAGSAAKLRAYRLMEYRYQQKMSENPAPADETAVAAPTDFSEQKKLYLKKIAKVLSSRGWRYTSILRVPRYLRGKKDPRLADCLDMSEEELATLLGRLRRSTSLRIAGALRSRKVK